MKIRISQPLLIWLAAIGLRFVYFFLLKPTPFFEPLSQTLDDGAFWKIAQTIAAGDWLCRIPEAAYRAPVYSYFVAVIIRLFGPSLTAVHLTQALIGSLTPVLVFLIARQIFGPGRIPLLAGILTALYMPFVIYENFLLGESLSVCLNAAGLWLLIGGLRTSKHREARLLASGVLFGISALIRPNVILACAFMGAGLLRMLSRQLHSWKRGLLAVTVFGAGILLALAPYTARNYVIHKDFIPLGAMGGVNLMIGNNTGSTGTFRLLPGGGTRFTNLFEKSHATAERFSGKTLKPSEASAFWTRAALRMMAEQPWQETQLVFRKALLLFNAYEIPNIVDIRLMAEFLPIIRANPIHYGLVALLGFTGWGLLLRRREAALWVLHLFFLGSVFSILIFFVIARYRLAIIMPLAIYAAWFLDAAIVFFGQHRRPLPPGVIILLLCTGFLVYRPAKVIDFSSGYNTLGAYYAQRKEFDKAEEFFNKSIQIRPNYPTPYNNLAHLMLETEQPSEAARYRKKFESLTGFRHMPKDNQ
ncbi:MAG: glycosyltransferase family 39 protein [Candidatus Omnitrophica bacterium]|nr:glycosyltransferase family 39 protein [Candidatus Omnitrophota bacterium]